MKYNLKKINFSYILIFTILIGFFSSPSFAVSNEEQLISGEINLQSIVKNVEESSDVEVKGPFTIYELANEMSKIENISIDEALRRLAPNGSIELFSLPRQDYYTYSRTLDVDTTYKPKIVFYAKVLAQDVRTLAFFEILDVSMNRGYNGISKAFGGDIYINLEDNQTLYYRVSGDFYNNGTTTVSGGIKIGIGEECNFNFNISHSSNHFKYYYATNRLYAYER